MSGSKALATAALTGALAVGSMFAAAPASAAVLPADQQITTIDGFSEQFSVTSTTTGQLTDTGTPAGIVSGLVRGVDVDDSGQGYAVSSDTGFVAGRIWVADAAAGTLSGGVQVYVENGEIDIPMENCTGVDVTDDAVWVACTRDTNVVQQANYIGMVDPVSGELTLEWQFVTLRDGYSFVQVLAIAISPIDGTFWMFDIETGTNVPQAFGAWTLVEGEDPQYEFDPPQVVLSADFDRNGALWFAGFGADGWMVASMDLTDGSTETSATPNRDGVPDGGQREPLTVWDAPPVPPASLLPATGASAEGPVVIAALVVLAGLVAVDVTRRRRRAEMM